MEEDEKCEAAMALLREIDEYLSVSALESINTGCILHQKIKQLVETDETDDGGQEE